MAILSKNGGALWPRPLPDIYKYNRERAYVIRKIG